MNYHRKFDVSPGKHLTVDMVQMFQSFRLSGDMARLNRMLDAEVARHIKACELAILYAAKCTFFWCRLPDHTIQDVQLWSFRHLEEQGFNIDWHREIKTENVRNKGVDAQEQTISVFESYPIASWLHGKKLNKAKMAKEFRRREKLEEIELSKNPPKPLSTVTGDTIKSGEAIWAAIVDKKAVVEIQRIFRRNYLCIFGLDGKLLHREETSVAFSAMFGPDSGDVAHWEERAIEIMDSKLNVPLGKYAGRSLR